MEVQSVRNIRLEHIAVVGQSLRKEYGTEGIQELATSLSHDGLLQPIIVRPMSNGKKQYQVVVGSRRFMAAQQAGLAEITAIVTDLDDLKSYEVALIENLQREDLTIFEEAIAIFNLMKTGGYTTPEDLAKRLGKSVGFVRNRVKLLQLPESVQRHVAKGTLTLGQAQAISRVPETHRQVEVANLIAGKNMTNAEARSLTLQRTGSPKRRLKANTSSSPVDYLGRLDALIAGLANTEWMNVTESARNECAALCHSLSNGLVTLGRELLKTPAQACVTDPLRTIRKEVRGAYKAVELIALIEEAERRIRSLDLKTFDSDYHHAILTSIRKLNRVITSREAQFREPTTTRRKK